MMFTVYILYSERHKKHYTGYTSNLIARLESHNQFGKDWTSKFRPWKIIFAKDFESKTEALAYEKWLKSGKGRKFIRTLAH